MTEPSMVEKMARAAYEKFIEAVRDLEPSWDGLPQSHRDRMIDSQRAAIEAMREPTDAMMEAIHTAMFVDKYDCSQAPLIGAGWEAGIDAALQEGKEGE